MATITITVKDEQLWSAVLGSAFETWSWWRDVSYPTGSDWETPGTVMLTLDDPEHGESDGVLLSRTLTIDDIVRGYQLLLQQFQFDVTPYDLDFDAVSGDAVLQLAIFGELVYG